MANLLSRLDKIEKLAAPSDEPPLKVRIVTTDEEEREAERLLLEEGCDPASPRIATIRLVGMTEGFGLFSQNKAN